MKHPLYTPDADPGGGSVYDTTPDPQVADTPAAPALQIPAKEDEPVVPEPVTPPAITADSLAEAMKKAGIGPQALQQPAKQYTQADFDAAFKVFRPTPDHIAKLLAGGDAAVGVMQEISQAIAKQAVVMSAYQIAELKEQLLSEISPLKEYRTQQSEKELRTEFAEKNPDLKGFETVLEHVVTKFREDKRQFANKDEAFKAVREAGVALIKSLPGFENWKPGTAQPEQVPARGKMPTLSRGGGSNGASTGQAGVAGGKSGKSPGMSVFGDT